MLHRIGKTIAVVVLALAGARANAATLLNVSYDVSREFYKDYDAAFSKHWQQQGGGDLTINQSHGGSSKQARSVADGLEADVVTLNQASDIDFLAGHGLLPLDWDKGFANSSSPFSSTIVFLVRKGNPKGIRDWGDLVKPGVQVIIPNPKISGNGRYSYLAAWIYALKQPGGNDKSARDFVGSLFHNVPVLDAGGRAATTTFAERGIGDVLLTFENEVYLTQREFGADKVDIVYPSVSVEADLPVAVVSKYAQKHGTATLAQAYLAWLYSPEAQDIAAHHYLRPRDTAVFKRNASLFKPITLYSVKDVFGGWQQAQHRHFDDGGVFDQLYQPGK